MLVIQYYQALISCTSNHLHHVMYLYILLYVKYTDCRLVYRDI